MDKLPPAPGEPGGRSRISPNRHSEVAGKGRRGLGKLIAIRPEKVDLPAAELTLLSDGGHHAIRPRQAEAEGDGVLWL
jgi:hypothetical protein